MARSVPPKSSTRPFATTSSRSLSSVSSNPICGTRPPKVVVSMSVPVASTRTPSAPRCSPVRSKEPLTTPARRASVICRHLQCHTQTLDVGAGHGAGPANVKPPVCARNRPIVPSVTIAPSTVDDASVASPFRSAMEPLTAYLPARSVSSAGTRSRAGSLRRSSLRSARRGRASAHAAPARRVGWCPWSSRCCSRRHSLTHRGRCAGRRARWWP